MKKSALVTMILALILVLCIGQAVAEGEVHTSGDYNYVIQRDGSVCIVAYTGSATGTLNIPNELDSLHVTSIGSYAFDEAKFTGVTLPNTLLTLETAAFNDCRNITSIRIPEGVVYISGNPFTNCTGLTVINVSPKHPTLRVTDDGVLYSKNTRTLLCYPCAYSYSSHTIPEGTLAIGRNAFEGCTSLTSVTIPQTVRTIGDAAFIGCGTLGAVSIPDSVTYLGKAAFAQCKSLRTVKITNGISTIPGNAFYGCTSLASVTIPDTVITIQSAAFRGCSSLKELVIPSSVFEIGANAFFECGLQDITIPQSVTLIGEDAFEGNRISWLRVEENSYGYVYGQMYGYRVTTGSNNSFLQN